MLGAGTITFSTPDAAGETNSDPAILQVLGSQGYRLDIQMANGMRSVRMDGAYGAVRKADGHQRQIDARDAVKGLIAFPQLFGPNFPPAGTVVIDDGMAMVDGTQLHRITIQTPLPEPGTKSIPLDSSKRFSVGINPATFPPLTYAGAAGFFAAWAWDEALK